MKQADLIKFKEKTPDHERKQRKIHGRTMDYVDGRYVMDRLDEVAGPGHWKTSVEQADFSEDGYAFTTTISIWVDELEQWVPKTDGGGQDSNKNASGQKVGPENDFKGALSDSFKRAGVLWGIGRDLYQPEKTFEEEINPNRISEDALDALIEEILKAELDDGQTKEFKGWLAESKFSLGKVDGKSGQRIGWNVEPEQLEGIYRKLSEIKEPI